MGAALCCPRTCLCLWTRCVSFTAHSGTPKHPPSTDGTKCVYMKPGTHAACILAGVGSSCEHPPPSPAHRKEGSLEDQGSGKEESCQPSSQSLTQPHTLRFQATFLFAPPPPYGLNRVGRARPGQWVWLAGCHALPQGCLPTWCSVPGAARQPSLLTPSASHQAELGE